MKNKNITIYLKFNYINIDFNKNIFLRNYILKRSNWILFATFLIYFKIGIIIILHLIKENQNFT
jgi:hypothetical protein